MKKELEKKNFKIVEENDKCLCFRGNCSYTFYVGDINVDIMDKEIRLSGTKYVLNKVLTELKKDIRVEESMKKRKYDIKALVLVVMILVLINSLLGLICI